MRRIIILTGLVCLLFAGTAGAVVVSFEFEGVITNGNGWADPYIGESFHGSIYHEYPEYDPWIFGYPADSDRNYAYDALTNFHMEITFADILIETDVGPWMFITGNSSPDVIAYDWEMRGEEINIYGVENTNHGYFITRFDDNDGEFLQSGLLPGNPNPSLLDNGWFELYTLPTTSAGVNWVHGEITTIRSLPVPEPATSLLFGLGMVIMGMWGSRRLKKG